MDNNHYMCVAYNVKECHSQTLACLCHLQLSQAQVDTLPHCRGTLGVDELIVVETHLIQKSEHDKRVCITPIYYFFPKASEDILMKSGYVHIGISYMETWYKLSFFEKMLMITSCLGYTKGLE